jgi:hypothetical protein
MIPVCIFTYSGDALPIRESVRSVIAAGLFPVVCDDAANPLPRTLIASLEDYGAEYTQTAFRRRGNLNGTDTAAGIARTLYEACGRYGTSSAIKMDSDTILIDPTPFMAGNVGVMSTETSRRSAFGCVYALTALTALEVAKELEFGILDESAPEDLAIWDAVAAIQHPRTMHDFKPDGGAFSAVPIGSDPCDCGRFAALTFGNTPATGWTDRGLQIFREMQRFNNHLAQI